MYAAPMNAAEFDAIEPLLRARILATLLQEQESPRVGSPFPDIFGEAEQEGYDRGSEEEAKAWEETERDLNMRIEDLECEVSDLKDEIDRLMRELEDMEEAKAA